jgi:[ribosomal protein S5]-alanine N-acetyltransferase
MNKNTLPTYKIGMKKEGILREHVIKENDYIDLVYYGILKTEFNLYN